jgi:hypothetical protein
MVREVGAACGTRNRAARAPARESGEHLLNLGAVSTLTTSLCNLDILVR